MPSPRASLTRWDGITHAIVDILRDSRDSREYVDPRVAMDLARTTTLTFTVRVWCGRRCKYNRNTTNRITNSAATCLWCVAERNL